MLCSVGEPFAFWILSFELVKLPSLRNYMSISDSNQFG